MEREYAIVSPRPEGEDGNFHWWLTERVLDRLESTLARSGEYIKHLLTAGSGLDKYMLPDGGSVSCENVNVFEVSSPETYHAGVALSYLEDYRGLLAWAADSCSQLPEGSLLSEGPGVLPVFGPPNRARFELAFHLNFAAQLTQGQGLELCDALAVLVPLLGGGGLTTRGFSCSPRGFTVRNSLRQRSGFWQRDEMVCLDRDETFHLGEDEPCAGYHVHVSCLDSPLTRRTAAFLFEACRLLIILILYGHGPLRGRRLAHPEKDCLAWSTGDLSHRCRLQGGGTVDLRELHEGMRAGLEEAMRVFALKPAQESALEMLLLGLRAMQRGDEEELALHFDGYLKKKIYRALLANEGVSLSFFDRVAVPVAWHASQLCSGLRELAALSPKEAEKLVSNGNGRKRRKILSLLGGNRLSPRDIPSLAKLVQRMLNLEIRLHQFHPIPSPLADYERRLWEAYLASCEPPSNNIPPTRAALRGRLVKVLGELAGYDCRADWSNIYVLAPHEMVGVFSLPDPHLPQAHFRWVKVPLSVERWIGGNLLNDLATNRYIFFTEEEEYREAMHDDLPYLPDGHPLLRAVRFGVPEGQTYLFDVDDMEMCSFRPGRESHVPAGQLPLF